MVGNSTDICRDPCKHSHSWINVPIFLILFGILCMASRDFVMDLTVNV
jgi:hypothetical protein